jgi:hypothetical protein
MKSLVAILLVLSMFGCTSEKTEENRLSLKKIELNYFAPDGREFGAIYYFDMENEICYKLLRGSSVSDLITVDSVTCRNLFIKYILPKMNGSEFPMQNEKNPDNDLDEDSQNL